LKAETPSVRGKTRTREHVLADLSINHVERQVLLCGFSVDRVQHDYGYDLSMATYGHEGEYEPGGVYIQVKATDRLPRIAGGKTISWLFSRRDLKLWLEEAYPVILVVYHGHKDRACWIHIQAYILDRRTPDLFAGGETIAVHVPIGNRLQPAAIQAIARIKNAIHKPIRGGGPKHVSSQDHVRTTSPVPDGHGLHRECHAEVACVLRPSAVRRRGCPAHLSIEPNCSSPSPEYDPHDAGRERVDGRRRI
jgi:hypothetical protein